MANWADTNPNDSTLYTAVLAALRDRDIDVANGFNSAPSNPKARFIRFVRSTYIWEEYDGSAWQAGPMVLGLAGGGTGSTTAAGARTNLGLGSIATQSAASVSITGGTIAGLSSLGVSGDVTVSGRVIAQSSAANALTATGGLTIGSGSVALVNTAGKITAISSTYFASLSGANLTTLNASNLSSGTVPDARFPGTLPAASGVNLTALNASNLGSGTIPNARIQASGVTQHQASITGTGALNSGSITSGFGNINIGSSTLDAGAGTFTTGTFTGLVLTTASASGGSGLRLPHGVDPSSPVNGDIWTTSATIFVYINGSTHDIRNASQIHDGTLPDGRFPSTLPALSGVNLTALNASNLGSGTIANARVQESNVTQHEAALTIVASQIPAAAGDVTGPYTALVVGNDSHNHGDSTIDGLSASATTTGSFADGRIPSLATSKITSGTFDNARIAESNVTQHEAALTILESQITNAGVLARVGSAETITGAYVFSTAPEITASAGTTPDVQKIFKESLVKAWAFVNDSKVLQDDYNVASVADGGTGYVDVTFGTELPNATYAVIATATGDGISTSIVSKSTTVFRVRTSVTLTGAATDNGFTVVVIGE